jgi:hypothetical protein
MLFHSVLQFSRFIGLDDEAFMALGSASNVHITLSSILSSVYTGIALIIIPSIISYIFRSVAEAKASLHLTGSMTAYIILRLFFAPVAMLVVFVQAIKARKYIYKGIGDI